MKMQTTSIYTRIRRIPKAILLSNIQDEYFYIKGNSNQIPITSDYGCVEFATALLVWRDINKYLYSYNKIHGNEVVEEFKNKFAEGLGLAFNYTNDLKWSKYMYNVITTTELITYKTWQKIYSYLRINFLDQLKKMEFYRNWYFVKDAHKKNSEFKRLYSSMSSFNMKLSYYKDQGLMLDSYK